MTKTATIYRMKTSDHVCPFGIRAKDLLRRRGYQITDHILTNREETDAFKNKYAVSTTPQVFIDEKRIGGFEALREYLDEAPSKSTRYTPVLAIFSMAALIAVALNFGTLHTSIQHMPALFIALSMCFLATQKLQDLDAFATQFVTYDLLAQKRVSYAYAYAYLEAFSGLAMIAQLPVWIAAPPMAIIGTLGTVSVYKAVYIDKRELKCACVGGNSKVPLGVISLTENLAMLGMAIWMLT